MVDNIQVLEQLVMSTVKQAIDATTEIALEKLKRTIDEVVYMPHNQVEYERTQDFRESWDRTNAIIINNIAESTIFQDYIRMRLDLDKFTHGSNYGGDIRPNLAEIINEGLSGLIFGKGFWTQPRPFWDEWIDWCDKNIFRIFSEECVKLGLPLENLSFAIS